MLSAMLYLIPFLAGIAMSLRLGPVLIFMVYQLDYFLNPQNKWWGSLLPFVGAQFYLVLTMILVFMLRFGKYGPTPVFSHPQFRYMLLTILMFALAYFNAPFSEYHLIALDAFVTVAIVVFLITKFCTQKNHIYWIVDAYLFSAFLLSFYIYGWGRNSSGRVEGVGMVDANDSNLVSAALVPTIVIFIGKVIAEKRWLPRCAYGVGLLVTTNALILINSRGAFVGAAIGIAYFLFVSLKNNAFSTQEKRAIFFGMILFAGAFLRLADTTFLERMLTMKTEATESTSERQSGSTRVYFWIASIELAKDYPFGTGASGFVYHSPYYLPTDLDTGKSRNRAVHSTWFEVLSEAGFLGLLFFTLMIYKTYKAFVMVRRKLWNEKDFVNSAIVLAVSSGFISFVVSATFINRLRAEVLYWLVALSICMYNVFMEKNKVDRNH